MEMTVALDSTSVSTHHDEKQVQSHHSHTVSFHLWTYVVIFSSIMMAVIVAEKFFFV